MKLLPHELQHTATHCNTRHHTATHGTTPLRTRGHTLIRLLDKSVAAQTATHYNTLQRAATHYITLHHTAPHLCAHEGTRSEGLRMKVLPHAIANGNIHNGIMAGKLKGAMPPHTPKGTLQVCVCVCECVGACVGVGGQDIGWGVCGDRGNVLKGCASDIHAYTCVHTHTHTHTCRNRCPCRCLRFRLSLPSSLVRYHLTYTHTRQLNCANELGLGLFVFASRLPPFAQMRTCMCVCVFIAHGNNPPSFRLHLNLRKLACTYTRTRPPQRLGRYRPLHQQ